MIRLTKLGNTPFEFSEIDIELDDNVFLAKLSLLNELRRTALAEVESFAVNNIKRKVENSNNIITVSTNVIRKSSTPKISLLLNIINLDFDYSKLENVDNLYIPLKYFANKKFSTILETLCTKFNLYIYLPTIIKANYRNMLHNDIELAVSKYNIKGFVLSNISNFVLVEDLCRNSKLELIANYTFNIYNNNTAEELHKLGISKYTVSPELDKNSILKLDIPNCKKEIIVYGKLPLMNINYCLLGKTNKCFPQCDAKCRDLEKHYSLKDRLQMNFDILPDNLQTVTTIYNSKTLSILPSDFNLDFARIDILYENIEEINHIILTVKSDKKFEGKTFTNGNLNRDI